VLIRARATENHVWLVTSAYGNPSQIIDPEGTVLATTDLKESGVAVAEIDLNSRPYLSPWLGDMRARFFKEHREDLR
jgi:predicted amidohydrolase